MKRIIALLAALVIASSAYAQIGIVAGLTSSSSDMKTAWAEVKNINQYHLGLAFKMDLGLFAIQPEVVYNVKGQKLSDATGFKDINFKTGYLEVPVQLQAGVRLGGFRAFAFAEPFVGYAITNEVKVDKETIKGIADNWENIKNRLEYGVSLGAGLDITRATQLSVKYFWNLGDLYGQDIKLGEITHTLQESKCSGIAVSLGLFF